MKFKKSTLNNQASELYNIETKGFGKAALVAIIVLLFLVGIGLTAIYA
tara:strand:+ start:74100 stop:74243 length:144 start_codon:yes stop_codon:yes gene_type:complete